MHVLTRRIWKMLGPFATASRRTPPVLYCHSPGVATVAHRHCRTPPAHRCPQQHRQRVTEGTAMAPWNGPNKTAQSNLGTGHTHSLVAYPLMATMHNRSTIFTRWHLRAHPCNRLFLEPIELTITNNSLIGSPIFAKPMLHSHYCVPQHFPS